ncbi:MAG: HigA family addiction module antidote protein [Acidobacteria bacterium]|nr:HigA family addiction module antidote protein [Acidobacteriota bacterium]
MPVPRTGNPNWRVHPGEVLREEFLKPLKMKPAQLAKKLCVSAPTVNEIVRERRAVSADMAVRLAWFFNTTEQFWLGLQAAYDVSRERAHLSKTLKKITPLGKIAAVTVAAVGVVPLVK